MKKLLASADDIFHLAEIYFDVYEGTYSDPLMRDPQAIKNYILSHEGFWFIAKTEEGQVVASVLINYDQENLIAKAYGAVVRHEFRGKNLMEDLLQFGIDYLKEHTNGVDIIYSTTRTVNEAAQTLTEHLGFKKLGIFPNTHRTRDFETHCLTAIITPEALAKRHSDYKIHHDVENLFNIVAGEIPLPPLESIVPVSPTKELIDAGELEVIRSKKFVNYRYNQLKNDRSLEFEFFPFHKPNLVILSPDQSIELFCSLSDTDGHCVVIGGKMPSNLNFTDLFVKTNSLLREAGARYIEVLVRADRPKIVESILKSKFIPCAFFPAFQLQGEKRYDFLVLSRSYEIFDFQNVKLKGVNQSYLEEYYKTWKKMALTPKLLGL